MAVITSGATPLALPGGMSQAIHPQDAPVRPLVDELPKHEAKKPPKIKKRAFGPNQPGAAFRK